MAATGTDRVGPAGVRVAARSGFPTLVSPRDQY